MTSALQKLKRMAKKSFQVAFKTFSVSEFFHRRRRLSLKCLRHVHGLVIQLA